jgi:hypothetical protein
MTLTNLFTLIGVHIAAIVVVVTAAAATTIIARPETPAAVTETGTKTETMMITMKIIMVVTMTITMVATTIIVTGTIGLTEAAMIGIGAVMQRVT